MIDWVNRKNINMGLHFKPQYQFLCTKKLEIEVDYVGYFENIESDYEYIQSRLNIEKTRNKKCKPNRV